MLNEKTIDIKKEIRKKFKAIIVLFISVIPIANGWSIINFFGYYPSDKIEWTVDYAIYTFIVDVFFSVAFLKINSCRTKYEVNILNKKEENSMVTIDKDKPTSVTVSINITGRKNKKINKLEIYFPRWLDIQLKGTAQLEVGKKYVHVDYESSKLTIDIESILIQNKLISKQIGFNIDLIYNANDDIAYMHTDIVQAILVYDNCFNKLLSKLLLSFKSNQITIKLR